MPKQYEAIKKSYLKRGAPVAKAKSIAAATYNRDHPGAPMSPAHPNPEADAVRTNVGKKRRRGIAVR